jgi:RNA polymerase sigma factor (sigma-70 family)
MRPASRSSAIARRLQSISTSVRRRCCCHRAIKRLISLTLGAGLHMRAGFFAFERQTVGTAALQSHKIFASLIRLHKWMDQALRKPGIMAEQDRRISEAINREQARLRNFIRRRVADRDEAEDILQDVFYELIEAYRMVKPVEQVTAWLFRVARNRIVDLFRRKQREALRNATAPATADGERLELEELLPSPDAGPDAAYARMVLMEELEAALDELPDEQREVFIAHEVMGRSFKELAAESGANVSTLLSRKHYAVLHLRERLQAIHDEFTKS